MRGKKICSTLKKVRLDIAKANGIKYEVTECTHKGDCLGTCPKCEAEVKYLERELEKRRRSGIKVALAGVSAGLVAVTATSCSVWDPFGRNAVMGGIMPEGDVHMNAVQETNGDLPADAPVTDEDTTEPDTSAIPGELVDTDETEELVLDGDIAYFPDEVTMEELMGSIAYHEDTESCELSEEEGETSEAAEPLAD